MTKKQKEVLDIFEAYSDGLIDKETRNVLLEEANNGGDVDEEIVNKFKDLIDSLDSSNPKIKKKLQELMNKYTDSEKEDDDDDEDDESEDKKDKKECKDGECEDSEDSEETVEESVNTTIDNILYAFEYGYIDENTADELLEVFGESLSDIIKNASGKLNKSLEGLSPDYKIDSMYDGIKMYKQGKIQEAEKEKRRQDLEKIKSDLRKKQAIQTANMGIR